MTEVLENGKEVVKEAAGRISHVFWGPFIISWIALNWKAIFYVLTSKDDPASVIDCVLYSYSDLNYYFLFPFGVACFYVIISPFFIDPSYEWLRSQQSVFLHKAKKHSVKMKAVQEGAIKSTESLVVKVTELHGGIHEKTLKIKSLEKDIIEINTTVLDYKELYESEQEKNKSLEKALNNLRGSKMKRASLHDTENTSDSYKQDEMELNAEKHYGEAYDKDSENDLKEDKTDD